MKISKLMSLALVAALCSFQCFAGKSKKHKKKKYEVTPIETVQSETVQSQPVAVGNAGAGAYYKNKVDSLKKVLKNIPSSQGTMGWRLNGTVNAVGAALFSLVALPSLAAAAYTAASGKSPIRFSRVVFRDGMPEAIMVRADAKETVVGLSIIGAAFGIPALWQAWQAKRSFTQARVDEQVDLLKKMV